MVSDKGSLNIKDYPFAFSIAVLFFPNVLIGENISSFLYITLIGGVLGSTLTIINPVGLAIQWLCRRKDRHVFIDLQRTDRFTSQIITKNFRSALSSPSITYEADKIVGMVYFLAILSLALFKLNFSEFENTFELDGSQIFVMTIGMVSVTAGVILVLVHHVWGVPFRSSQSVTHLDRISSVTALNMGADFSNLCNDGRRWNDYWPGNTAVMIVVAKIFYGLDNFNIKNYDDFSKKFDTHSLMGELQILHRDWDKYAHSRNIFEAYKLLKETCLRYGFKPKEGVVWFGDGKFLSPDIFDMPTSQLQISIDSRDWYSAVLKTYKIIDILENFLSTKTWLSDYNK